MSAQVSVGQKDRPTVGGRRLWVFQAGRRSRQRGSKPTMRGWWTQVCDTTMTGLTLGLPSRLHVGTPLIVELPVESQRRVLALQVWVVEARPAAGGFLTECALADRLGSAERAALHGRG
jgi:hypothetical protein